MFSGCDSACPGDSSQKCGGPYLEQVYYKNLYHGSGMAANATNGTTTASTSSTVRINAAAISSLKSAGMLTDVDAVQAPSTSDTPVISSSKKKRPLCRSKSKRSAPAAGEWLRANSLMFPLMIVYIYKPTNDERGLT